MISTNLLRSRHFIKINACFIGYGIWLLMSQNQVITHTIISSVCFYHMPENYTIVAPETITLTVAGPKRILHQFDVYNHAIHLDATNFTEGKNFIQLQKENLFLPDPINLLNLVPSSLQITLQKN